MGKRPSFYFLIGNTGPSGISAQKKLVIELVFYHQSPYRPDKDRGFQNRLCTPAPDWL